MLKGQKAEAEAEAEEAAFVCLPYMVRDLQNVG